MMCLSFLSKSNNSVTHVTLNQASYDSLLYAKFHRKQNLIWRKVTWSGVLSTTSVRDVSVGEKGLFYRKGKGIQKTNEFNTMIFFPQTFNKFNQIENTPRTAANGGQERVNNWFRPKSLRAMIGYRLHGQGNGLPAFTGETQFMN